MLRRRFTANQQHSSDTKNYGWLYSIAAVLATIGTNTKTLLGSITLSNPGIEETIIRVVGWIFIQSDQLAASEYVNGAFGLIRVTDLAVAAGAASIPGPVTDGSDSGWFVHVPFVDAITVGDATGFNEGSSSGLFRTFDFKSKRILSTGEAFAIMAENNSASAGLQIGFGIRVLGMVRGT